MLGESELLFRKQKFLTLRSESLREELGNKNYDLCSLKIAKA
ncbi:hypothetical protein HMPREF1872_00877 [Amygdalobacter nucleatus]|uniref:Uncharacterized protein n=1 Tax=Amygdalobacter nucleatus TaxID=3029274 RepID=A0A133YAW3_9FIRM|nr:hypothetical protein HMPREF1872_00877 [Amygdalobacter nucleatus]